jgi:hypothetical protein
MVRASRRPYAIGAIGLGFSLISFALPIIGVPRLVAWVVFAVGIGFVITGCLWWYFDHLSDKAASMSAGTAELPELAERVGPTFFPEHGISVTNPLLFSANGGAVLLMDFRFTNKTQRNMNLNVELWWNMTLGGKPLGGPHKFFAPFGRELKDQLRFPLKVVPDDTVSGVLAFDGDLPFLTDELGEALVKSGVELTLVIEDYITSTSMELRAPLREYQ